MNNTPPSHSGDEIRRKKKLDLCKKPCVIRRGDFRSKVDPKPLFNEETERKNLERKN